MRQQVEDLICSDIPPGECLLKLSSIVINHQTGAFHHPHTWLLSSDLALDILQLGIEQHRSQG